MSGWAVQGIRIQSGNNILFNFFSFQQNIMRQNNKQGSVTHS